MAEKPSDYFLGTLDLFGILVPGAVSLALLVAEYPTQVQSISKIIDPGSGRAIAFVVAAFLLGYLVHSASMALDRLYDSVQQRAFERFYGRDVYQRAKELKAEQLCDRDGDLIGTYRWALTSVRFLSPAWALELDRMAAHTALFRSLTLIIGLTTVALLVHKQWIPSATSAVLAACSLRIYQNLRWKNIRTVYEYYIALHALSKGGFSDAIQPFPPGGRRETAAE